MKNPCPFFVLIGLLLAQVQYAQTHISDHYKTDSTFDNALNRIIKAADLEGSFETVDGPATVSFAVIDLNEKKPVFGGVHSDFYIYPASVYKMYVAMEVLKQVGHGRYKLQDQLTVENRHNVVDSVKEILTDPRPLIKKGDPLTIGYLLDLMITRSDNTAANILIDLAQRPKINTTLKKYGWEGSKVTRKFLERKYEDPNYKNAEGTETSALDAADFMYKLYTEQLVNPWVSLKLKTLLGGQLDNTKLAKGLPEKAMFYHKTGWWNMFTNDVGLVDDGEIQYIIALFTPLPEEKADLRLKKVSQLVYELIKKRNPTSL